MYYIFCEAYDPSGEGMRAVLNMALTKVEANDCVSSCQQQEGTTRVILIEGKTLVNWAPEEKEQLDSEDLQKSGVE